MRDNFAGVFGRWLEEQDFENQEAAAVALGVRQQDVSRWRNDRGLPRGDRIPDLARRMRVDEDALWAAYTRSLGQRHASGDTPPDEDLFLAGHVVLAEMIETLVEAYLYDPTTPSAARLLAALQQPGLETFLAVTEQRLAGRSGEDEPYATMRRSAERITTALERLQGALPPNPPARHRRRPQGA